MRKLIAVISLVSALAVAGCGTPDWLAKMEAECPNGVESYGSGPFGSQPGTRCKSGAAVAPSTGNSTVNTSTHLGGS